MTKAKKDRILKSFANNLEKYRQQKKMSLRALAAASELEYSQVQRISKGRVNLEFTTFIALARGLEVDPGKLAKLVE